MEDLTACGPRVPSAGDDSARPAASDHRYDVIGIDVDGILHALNDGGAYVGQRVTSEHAMRAIQFTTTGIADLGTLGGSASSARGINESGSIVGGALTIDDVSYHAFLYEAGVMHDLNDLIASGAGWELIQALGINNRGEIIAIGHHDGCDRVVLLKPRSAQ